MVSDLRTDGFGAESGQADLDSSLQRAGISADAVTLKEHDREKSYAGSCPYIKVIVPASSGFFNEKAYLAINLDVTQAIAAGQYANGLDHFCKVGYAQHRKMFFNEIDVVKEAKMRKLERFRDVFLPDLSVNARTFALDTVGEDFSETVPISSWGYNADVFSLIERHRGGVIVDLGAGLRPEYFDDIINIEIGNFITTDVRSFAEKLPFKDQSIDCLFSLAVFEHVSRPWEVAKEIERVVKPGGSIYIDTAFMAARHAFPFHYYNMTVEGLANLFKEVTVDKVGASIYGHPTYSLYWLARTFREGLPGTSQIEFDKITIGEMLSYSDPYFMMQEKPFLLQLDPKTVDDIAFNVSLLGRKRP